MEQNQNNEIDLRKIARVVLEHWWWFLVSVAALSLIGTLYYLRTPFRWTTDASIVLRTQDMHFPYWEWSDVRQRKMRWLCFPPAD